MPDPGPGGWGSYGTTHAMEGLRSPEAQDMEAIELEVIELEDRDPGRTRKEGNSGEDGDKLACGGKIGICLGWKRHWCKAREKGRCSRELGWLFRSKKMAYHIE